jgi:hypothetical protein
LTLRLDNNSKIADDKHKEDDSKKILADIRAHEEVGFPSKYWFSDHIPVGATLSF